VITMKHLHDQNWVKTLAYPSVELNRSAVV
jgi:hypothetical protein